MDFALRLSEENNSPPPPPHFRPLTWVADFSVGTLRPPPPSDKWEKRDLLYLNLADGEQMIEVGPPYSYVTGVTTSHPGPDNCIEMLVTRIDELHHSWWHGIRNFSGAVGDCLYQTAIDNHYLCPSRLC